MALTGAAKTAYQRDYMSTQRALARAHASARRKVTRLDRDVWALAIAGYLNQEIAEAMDLTDSAVRGALARLGAFLAPTYPTRRDTVNIFDCLPFNDDIYRAPGY